MVSLRYACSVSFAMVASPRCRLRRSLAQYASALLHPAQRALRLRRPIDVNDMLYHSGLFTKTDWRNIAPSRPPTNFNYNNYITSACRFAIPFLARFAALVKCVRRTVPVAHDTSNRAFAEFMWSSLDIQHSRAYANTRCWIPGRRKAFVRCRDTVPCATCPYKDKRQPLS